MIDPKPKLLIAEGRDFCPAAIACLENHFTVKLADLERAELLDNVHRCEYLWVRLRTMIDAEIMEAAPRLKTIVTNTTGLTHIDVDGARRRGIEIISLKGETEFLRTVRATGEHTLGLTLCLLRKIPAAHQHVCEGGWDRTLYRGREIHDKVVGVVGLGRLGKIVAELFRHFGAAVIVHDRRLAAGEIVDGCMSMSMSDLLAAADIVSLHVDFEPENRRMFGAPQFQGMKPGAIFVNTARGELVDEEALLASLESNNLAGAALDVIDSELAESPTRGRLVELARSSDRLILTPHIGGYTIESSARTELFVAQKLVDRFVDRQIGSAS